MQKFLLLFRGFDNKANPQSPEQMQSHMQKWRAWIDNLAEKGIFQTGDPISKDGKMLTGSGKTLTDGPYRSNGETVGGYFIINADTINHAVEISKGCPIFEIGGSVEVREIVNPPV